MHKPVLVIMAGGTGGHVFPGLAVAAKMLNLGWQVQWIGTRDKMEADIVPKHNINIHFVDIGGVRGKSWQTKLKTPFVLFSALIQAKRILSTINPDVVLGMGGYASGPGGLACKLLSIPLIVHEQNAVFGMTNFYLSKIATKTLTGFDLCKSVHKKPKQTHFVGNPIREGFFEIPLKKYDECDDVDSTINVLVVGGSLGALALNQIVPEVLEKVVQSSAAINLNVRHQAGAGKHHDVINTYNKLSNEISAEVHEFIDDMIASFTWADIIVCRAGALTVAEVAGAGRAAIFVPLPIAVDDHQTANAHYLSEQGAALVIQQTQLAQDLPDAILQLSSNHKLRLDTASQARQLSQSSATYAVADVIQTVAHSRVTSKKQATSTQDSAKQDTSSKQGMNGNGN